jgi:predicted nucleic acid-binding protein
MSERVDPFSIVVDANVLAGALTRNIILSLAEAGFFRPYWSSRILDEFERYCAERTGSAENAKRQRDRIEAAFPEAIVNGLKTIEEGLNLPDPDDCHVLAAAIKAKAEVIVTENVKDFPEGELALHDIEILTLDQFVADILDLSGPEAVAALRIMRERFNNPEITAEGLILKIETLGMSETADFLSEYKDLL